MQKSSLAAVANGALGQGSVFHSLGEHRKTVIFMHGLGDTAAGWADLPKFFNRVHKTKEQAELHEGIKFILPTAPTQPVTLNGGMSMPSWFDITGLDENADTDHAGLTASMNRVDLIIDDELKNNPKLSFKDIIVGGFSQGGAVAYYYNWNKPHTLGGMINLSTWLPDPKKNAPVNPEKFAKLHHFHGHGNMDFVVQYRWGQMSVDVMKELGATTTFKTYSGMQHSACQSEFEDIFDYINKVWAKPVDREL